jgi:arylsulfatase A-like enzyme
MEKEMIKQNKTKLLYRVAGACCMTVGASASDITNNFQRVDRPNILLILADDLGYGDVGVYGCKDIHTPVIDGLARDGMLFTDAYVTHSTCGPSRAGLLTGRHPLRFGFWCNPDYIIPSQGQPNAPLGLPPSEITVAQVLKEAGYRTGIVGKWHLGKHKLLHPMRFGFDSFYGILGAQTWYFDVSRHSETFDGVLRNYEFVKEPEYMTYGFAREAVDFVLSEDSRPWFMFLSFNAPHTPLMPDYWKSGDPIGARGPSNVAAENRLVYKNMVEAMDRSIGRVLNAVNKNGQLGNTLVVFLSDNGGTTISGAYDNGSLRGWKGDVFEGGIRVPFIARWPRVIPPGSRVSQVVSSLDLMPTFAAAAGASLPNNRNLDGVNLIPLFSNLVLPDETRTLFWRKSSGMLAVRQGQFKALLNERGNVMLFDLEKDLSEKTDLSGKFPEVTAELNKKMKVWQAKQPPHMWVTVKDWEGWRKQMGNFGWHD